MVLIANTDTKFKLARSLHLNKRSCIAVSENECSSSPCKNGGTCVDLKYGYRCICEPGYDPLHCEGMSIICPKTTQHINLRIALLDIVNESILIC